MVGSSLWIYLTKIINENKVYLYETWKTYIHLYLILTVSSSITMVYLNLPITNPKHIIVLRFFLYLCSACMILNGISDLFALTLLSCVLSLSYCFRRIIKLVYFKLVSCLIWIKKKLLVPKKRKLLSSEEYERESIEYTESQLFCLKKYCLDTPNYKIWPMLFSLTDPKR